MPWQAQPSTTNLRVDGDPSCPIVLAVELKPQDSNDDDLIFDLTCKFQTVSQTVESVFGASSAIHYRIQELAVVLSPILLANREYQQSLEYDPEILKPQHEVSKTPSENRRAGVEVAPATPAISLKSKDIVDQYLVKHGNEKAVEITSWGFIGLLVVAKGRDRSLFHRSAIFPRIRRWARYNLVRDFELTFHRDNESTVANTRHWGVSLSSAEEGG